MGEEDYIQHKKQGGIKMNPGLINPINILVTLDENYIPYLNVMLSTLIRSNPGCVFHVYLLHSSISKQALKATEKMLFKAGGCLIPIKADYLALDEAPTTSRYPQEIYYRIFAARYLPETLDRVLYLDPDLVLNGSILPLYQTSMEEYYYAAASHIDGLGLLHKFNELRLDMDDNSPYINSGVLLMNLSLLRKEQDYADVFHFIEKRKSHLVFPDQDIISSLYGSKIYTLDPFRYNMTEWLYRVHSPFEKSLDLNWVRKHSIIIHYCGRNKPWKENYIGDLDVFYKEAVAKMRSDETE